MTCPLIGDDGEERSVKEVINIDEIDAENRLDSVPRPKAAEWGDAEIESEEENADVAGEGNEEQEIKTNVKTTRGEPFEVPMQGQFWGHDDRFDEAEAAAHEE